MNRQEKWKKLLTTKNLAIVAGGLLIVALLPLLFLGKYNVMCYDDYFFGEAVHLTWLNTGSLKEAVKAAIAHANDYYVRWQGYWLAAFLTALYPANFDYGMAWIVPVLSIGLFATATYLLGKQIFTKWFGGERAEVNLVLFVVLFLYYQVIDSPFEGIYWYNGVITYIVPQAFLFLAVAVIVKNLLSEKEKCSVVGCVLASVCAIVGVGGNYVTALQAEIMLVLLLVYAGFAKRKRIWAALLPFLIGTIFFCISVFSPGNASRSLADGATGYNPVMAIILSFYKAAGYMIEWTQTIVVFVWIALLPILWHLVKKANRSFKYPILVTLGIFCVYSAMFTPTLYALGTAGLDRANNVIQMVYYLGLFGCTAYWIGWLQQRKQQGIRGFDDFLKQRGNVISAVMLCMVLFVWAGTMDKNTYASISAVRSIVNGEGKTFYEQSMVRHELYLDETIKEVVVVPFSEKPGLFDFLDLSEDKNNWLNQGVASYYQKDYVVLDATSLQE